MDEVKEEGGEDVRECSNCRHSIAAANLELHESHCIRHLALCERCGDAVPRGQLQEHVESGHSEVMCPCGVVLEKCQLEDHQGDTCDLRLCECRYCELALPQRELPEHEHFCGARTEPCPACGAFVQHRDKKAHALSCPRAHARLQQGQQEQQKHQQCLQKTLEQQEQQIRLQKQLEQQGQQDRLQKQLEQQKQQEQQNRLHKQQKHQQWLQEQQKQQEQQNRLQKQLELQKQQEQHNRLHKQQKHQQWLQKQLEQTPNKEGHQQEQWKHHQGLRQGHQHQELRHLPQGQQQQQHCGPCTKREDEKGPSRRAGAGSQRETRQQLGVQKVHWRDEAERAREAEERARQQKEGEGQWELAMERQKETRARIHMERRWESKRLEGTPERVGGPSLGTRRAKPARNLVSYSSDKPLPKISPMMLPPPDLGRATGLPTDDSRSGEELPNGHAGVLGDPEPSLSTPAAPSYRAPVTPGVDDWDRTSLPCEFCGLDFPADELILHQSGCNMELAHASVDYHYAIPTTTTTRIQHQPDDRRGHREPSRNAFSPRDPGNLAQRDPFTISDRLNPRLDASYCEPSRGPVHRLPCEICTELVEAERLQEHQHECLVQQLGAMRSFSSDPGSWTLDS